MKMSVTTCPLCLCTSSKLLCYADDLYFTRKRDYRIVQCTSCGLVRTETDTSQDNLEDCYADTYWDIDLFDIRAQNRRIEEYKARMRFMSTITSRGKFLEIGAGNGAFVAFLRRHGWIADGTDLFPGAAKKAKALFNVDLLVGDLADLDLHYESFQMIGLYHVLEHVFNPKELLFRINKVLRPDGTIIIEVPNIDCLQFELFKGTWFCLQPAGHIWHFSPLTLQRLLSDTGFEVIHTCHYSPSHGSNAFRVSIRKSLGNEIRSLLHNSKLIAECESQSNYEDTKTLETISFRSRLINLALNPLSVGFAKGESVLQKGAVITVAARKIRAHLT